jgi:hypothetical protein
MNSLWKIGTIHTLSEVFFHPLDSSAPFGVKKTSTAQELNWHLRTTRVIHPAFAPDISGLNGVPYTALIISAI